MIEELEGELQWVEALVWAAGPSTPTSIGSGASALRLAEIEARMDDAAPLVRAMLVGGDSFARRAFARNALGAEDAASFLARNEHAVREILRERRLEAVERLGDARAPVAPFASELAELACDERPATRRAALALLARDPEAARGALRSIAEDESRATKELRHAARALESLEFKRPRSDP